MSTAPAPSPDDLVPLPGHADKGFVVRREVADRLQTQLDEAMATLPPGALREGTRYDFKAKAWTIGTGPRIDELPRPFSMGCRAAIGDLEIIAPTTP